MTKPERDYELWLKVILIIAIIVVIGMSVFQSAQAIEQDKALHLTGSAALAYYVNDSFKESEHPMAYPFALSLGLGILKEVAIDSKADRNDISADAIGAFLGTGIANQDRILPSWNNTDKYLLQSYLVMSAIDVWQTDKAVNYGYVVNGAAYGESNFGTYGNRPTKAKLIVMHAAAGYLIYELADNYPEGRTAMLTAVNIMQFLVVRHNYFIVRF